jgi:hypothetical protein
MKNLIIFQLFFSFFLFSLSAFGQAPPLVKEGSYTKHKLRLMLSTLKECSNIVITKYHNIHDGFAIIEKSPTWGGDSTHNFFSVIYITESKIFQVYNPLGYVEEIEAETDPLADHLTKYLGRTDTMTGVDSIDVSYLAYRRDTAVVFKHYREGLKDIYYLYGSKWDKNNKQKTEYEYWGSYSSTYLEGGMYDFFSQGRKPLKKKKFKPFLSIRYLRDGTNSKIPRE